MLLADVRIELVVAPHANLLRELNCKFFKSSLLQGVDKRKLTY
jgi:hypothetical protein